MKPSATTLLAVIAAVAPPAAAQMTMRMTAPAPVRLSCDRASIGADAFCTASDGTRIDYIDWGGHGPAIVLLAGLGNSARIFDELAPQLTRGHRVIAITRRGYGLSADAAAGDYGNTRLVRDIIEVMDGLGIRRAAFVGHSIAGGELVTLGADYPDRVARLIYLDAAYDRTAVPAIMAGMPPIPGPTASDLADLPAITRWRSGALGVRSPAIASDLDATMRPASGAMRPRTLPAAAAAILAGDMASPPRYSRIQAPSLALYTSKDVAEQVPTAAPPALRHAVIAYSLEHIRPWMLREKARFVAGQHCGTAYEIPHSGHYLFLERPAWTARTILAYLASPSPCRFVVPRPGSN